MCCRIFALNFLSAALFHPNNVKTGPCLLEEARKCEERDERERERERSEERENRERERQKEN